MSMDLYDAELVNTQLRRDLDSMHVRVRVVEDLLIVRATLPVQLPVPLSIPDTTCSQQA